MNFSRVSKYRNIFCDAPTPEHTFSGLKFSTATGESNYIVANSKYAVYASQVRNLNLAFVWDHAWSAEGSSSWKSCGFSFLLIYFFSLLSYA